MKTVLLVGSSLPMLRNYLASNNWDYVVLKDKHLTKYPEKRFKNRVLGDFSSVESLLHDVDQIKKPIDAVLATYENYILPAAHIAEHLGLPGLPVDVALACTDKYIMRERFGRAPIQISPAYAEIGSEAELRAFADNHDFPLILKPANLAKSLLVTKNHSLEELLQNYAKMCESIDRVYAQYAPNRTPKILIEEFLHGSIHSVDAFCDSEGTPHVLEQVVDYQTGYDVGFDDIFHYSRLLPSKLSTQDIEAIRKTAEIGCRALGIKNSPAHVEVILTLKGPRIVEIGARNGGYRERMHSLANGIDITNNALRLALGEQPNIASTKNDPCAVLELFPKQPGAFEGIHGSEILAKLPSLVYFNIKSKHGQQIGKAADGYKMSAVVILHNADMNVFEKDLAFVNDNVHVETS